MSARGKEFIAGLEHCAEGILDACTRCGRCVDVCPTIQPGGVDASDPPRLVQGILDLLAEKSGTAEAGRWATLCNGSGQCIPACAYGVNPRLMLSLARLASQRQSTPADGLAERGRRAFQKMGHGVQVLSRLQLPPALRDRLRDPPEKDADVVFYTGCNILKTPHIALLCLDVLDALEVRYRVDGGPARCCGVLQFRAGDAAMSGEVGLRTIEHLSGSDTAEVLAWCPSCQVQLGEITLPTLARASNGSPFELTPFVFYLKRNLDRLAKLFVNPVHARVGLHEHSGVEGIGDTVRDILEAIPGLEFVDLEQPSVATMCATMGALPQYKRDLHEALLRAAEAAGVTMLAGVYHACHRELCSHERDWPFEVVNFMELVGSSMGIERPDLFKRLKLMQDVDAILADSVELIDEYEMRIDDVREVVINELLGEQTLPLKGVQ
ncbi:MAG: (Fe-S)-binding protein [Gammaproteobacteria bacterium]|nr:(Fe-S)-binding protein [Gammaproteobacteria bacterium]